MKKDCIKKSHVTVFITVLMLLTFCFLFAKPVSTFAATDVPGRATMQDISTPAFGQVKLTWKKTDNATDYHIYYKEKKAGKWTKLASVKAGTTSYTHKASAKYPLTTGRSYAYTVKAYYSKTKTAGKYDEQGVSANLSKTERPVTPTPAQPAVPTPIPPGVHPTLMTDITLSRRSITMTSKGDRVFLDSMVLPFRAYYKMLGWVSSDPSVVSVDGYDYLASSSTMLTAVGNGTAVVTAYALDGSGLTAQCKVTVDYKDDNGTSELPSIPDDQNTQVIKVKSIKLSQTSVTITDKKKHYVIEATYSPSNATVKGCRWTTSDKSVVLVNSGWATEFSKHYLTPVGNGTAVITAHALDGSGVVAKCVVTVNMK